MSLGRHKLFIWENLPQTLHQDALLIFVDIPSWILICYLDITNINTDANANTITYTTQSLSDGHSQLFMGYSDLLGHPRIVGPHETRNIWPMYLFSPQHMYTIIVQLVYTIVYLYYLYIYIHLPSLQLT